MVGTTRSRVSPFLNKFRKLGFIEYNGKILGIVDNPALAEIADDANARPRSVLESVNSQYTQTKRFK